MSADNYYYVFKRGEKYVVQCRFASDEYQGSDRKSGGREFDTLAEATAYAYDEYSEYGVKFGPEFVTTVTEVEPVRVTAVRPDTPKERRCGEARCSDSECRAAGCRLEREAKWPERLHAQYLVMLDERDEAVARAEQLERERVEHIPDVCAGHYRRVMYQRDEAVAQQDKARERSDALARQCDTLTQLVAGAEARAERAEGLHRIALEAVETWQSMSGEAGGPGDNVSAVRLERTREYLRAYGPEYGYAEVLAELEKAEAVIAAAEHVLRNDYLGKQSKRRLRSALAAFGSREGDTDESLCHFCRKVSRPWMTDDATWALVEPVLGQSQACLECFYDALPADATRGEPLVVSLPRAETL